MEDAHVVFEGVCKSFGEHTVLDDVSFSIPKSEAYCLLGRSGVGKSVTLKLLIGLVDPDKGRIVVDGKNVPELSDEQLVELRKNMGFLFQYSALFDSLSVGGNVSFPLRRHSRMSEEEIRATAIDKLEQVGLAGQYDKMPSDLSGGMKKRAGLARALAMDPEILLIDEPSAGLDPITAREIDDLLLETKARLGTTMVLVTHNIPSARRVGDRLAILHAGRIAAEGTASELDENDDEMVRAFMRSESGG